MALKSALFKGIIQLERCLTHDSAHILLNASGEHVARIQQALRILDGASIDVEDIRKQRYGQSTARAVLAYKAARKIVNASYQTKPDSIVGKMTIAAMDKELVESPAPPPALRRVNKFVASPRRQQRDLNFICGGFGPVGPNMSPTNGYDPNPGGANQDPTRSFQMVPANNGTRTIFIVDPGWPGTPIYRFELSAAATGGDVSHIVSMEEQASVGARKIVLTGRGFGGAILRAVNTTTNAVEATLEIAVLNEQTYSIGFAILREQGKPAISANGSVEQFLQVANTIWTSQANIRLTQAGSPQTIEVAPFDKDATSLNMFGPSLLPILRRRIGEAKRYVAIVADLGKEANGAATNGFTNDVIFLDQSVRFDWRTFAHEFGHSIGRSHDETLDASNLMWGGRDDTLIQTALSQRQITNSNLRPGTWKDAL